MRALALVNRPLCSLLPSLGSANPALTAMDHRRPDYHGRWTMDVVYPGTPSSSSGRVAKPAGELRLRGAWPRGWLPGAGYEMPGSRRRRASHAASRQPPSSRIGKIWPPSDWPRTARTFLIWVGGVEKHQCGDRWDPDAPCREALLIDILRECKFFLGGQSRGPRHGKSLRSARHGCGGQAGCPWA